MEATARIVASAMPEVVFEDGLGIRYLVADPSGASATEVLALRTALSAVPSFEFALRERVARLGAFSHPSFTQLRGVERVGGIEAGLRLRSDGVDGTRLSRLIDVAQAQGVFLDIKAALCLTRQLVAALAALHDSARDLSHGAISTERLVVTPQGRLIVVEHGVGAALQQLRYSREQYWTELRLALPASNTAAVLFDQRVDVTQIGVVALALILGRRLKDGEIPAHMADLVGTAQAVSPRGGIEPLPTGLRGWLARALQLDPLRSFASALDARNELDAILGASDDLASASSLEAFLDRLEQSGPLPGVAWPQDLVDGDEEPQIPEPLRDIMLADIDTALTRGRTPAPTVVPFAPSPLPAVRRPEPEPEPEPVLESAHELEQPAADLDEWPKVVYTPRPVDAEAGAKPAPLVSKGQGRVWPSVVAGVVSASIAATVGVKAASRVPMEPAVALAPGTLELSSGPAGVDAFVDGAFRGLTPLSIDLAPGVHTIELYRPSAERQSIPITLMSGMKVSQYADVPLAIGDGALDVDAADASSDQGSTEPSQPVPVAQPSEMGWVSVVSDAKIRIFENDALIGSSRDRVELPSGEHELTLVDDLSGINTTRVVKVETRKTAVINVAMPTGALAVVATPRAEVWVDGNKRGDTPIGSLTLPAGAHDIVLRHAELGDRRRAVVVTAGELVSLSVDLRVQ
ncbi:MAG: PEGA domain-containing protein [Vicinamibacterales bacterium]